MKSATPCSASCLSIILRTLAFGFAVAASSAGALELEPGNWKITTVTTTPMSPDPITQETEDCIEAGEDPVALMQAEMAEQCQLTTNTNTDSELDADMACTIPGAGSMTGKLIFKSNGDNATGEMTMTMNMGGQVMQMSSSWSGEHQGACAATQ